MILLHAYHLGVYYLTLLLFALGGLVFNLYCMVAGVLPAGMRSERHFQRVIHRLFGSFVGWMQVARVMRFRYEGLERLTAGGCVVVANHPGLMDITFLLARIPEAISVFKPSIRRNPVLGAGARLAGYICSDGGPDLVRQAGDKTAAGQTLIIFPEGTRTPPGISVGPFRPGFVLIARRAGVPIQLVRITWDSNVLVKGRAWWKLPRLPGTVRVSVGPRVDIAPEERTEIAAARIEAWFRDGESAEASLA